MIKKLLISIFLLGFFYKGFSQSEILRHFDPNIATYQYPSGFNLLIARFEPEAPGLIKKIRIKVGGTMATGSLEITLFGHEGGTSFPQLELPLFPWITLNKTVAGEEWISLELPTPIKSVNTQFFIAFKNLKNGARIYAENKPAAATCKSGSGGDYYFMFLKTLGNQWTLGSKNAFAVEVEMEYKKLLGNPFFKDFTNTVGIDTNIGNSVIAWADVDNDGFQDLLTQSKFYKNEAGISFSNQTSKIGYSGSASAMFVDLDNDYDLDILAFFSSGDSGIFFRNEGGLIFKKIKTTGLKSFPSISSFSAADIDGDGFPEIFIGQLWGAYPEPYPNYLFKNNGNGVFSDITNKLYPNHNGLANFPEKVVCKSSDQATWLSNGNTNRRSRGSSFVDFDSDGDLDLYITNYFLEPDEFFRNNGDGTFTDIISEKGIDKNNTGSNHGTGIDFGDYNNDGNFDILLPQFSHPAFALQYDHRNTTVYKNSGKPDYNFTDLNKTNEMVNPPSGIQYEETYAGGTWGDVNNDGLLDFYISVFYGCRYVKLYLQNPDHTFSLKTYDYGLQKLNTGEDATWLDFNNDGLLDLCSGDEGRIRLYKNEGEKDTRFITFDIKAANGNLFAIGSKVIVYSGGQKLTRQITAGRGVRHQSPYRLHFGLGKNSIDKVEVYWPDGSMETIFGFMANRNYFIEQGKPVEGLLSVQNELLLFGNPGSQIQVNFLTQNSGNLKIKVIDVAGRIVKNIADETIESGSKTYAISGNDFVAGTYLVQAIFNGKTYCKRWININP